MREELHEWAEVLGDLWVARPLFRIAVIIVVVVVVAALVGGR